MKTEFFPTVSYSMCLFNQPLCHKANVSLVVLVLPKNLIRLLILICHGFVTFSTYTPGHEVGETPIILFVEEQVTDPAAEGLLVIFVIDDLQHGLCMA